MKNIEYNNLENFIAGGEVTFREGTSFMNSTGMVMMMVPGFQLVGFGIAAISLAANHGCE